MKFTLITICYNNLGTIEATLKSVHKQTYSDIEHIIIDGASTDGTLEIIKKHKKNNAIVISESDKGMYDAIYLIAYAMLTSNSTEPNIFKTKLQEVSKDGEVIGINKFAEAKALIEAGTDIDYNGASGKIEFDENGDVSSGTYEIWEVENSTFITKEVISFP